MYYVIKFKGWWGDEMRLESARIVDKKEKNEFEAVLKKIDELDEPTLYIGTNEEMYIDTNDFRIEKLDIDEKTFEKLEEAGLTNIDPQGIIRDLPELLD